MLEAPPAALDDALVDTTIALPAVSASQAVKLLSDCGSFAAIVNASTEVGHVALRKWLHIALRVWTQRLASIGGLGHSRAEKIQTFLRNQ